MNLKERLERANGNTQDSPTGIFEMRPETTQLDRFADLKATIHQEVIDTYNARFSEGADDAGSIDVKSMIRDLIAMKSVSIRRTDEDRIVQEIYDDVMGLGPLEPLLRDPDVTEIMVNGAKDVYVERKGKLELTGVLFRDDQHVINVINRIVSAVGRRCDESNPMVDARLEDGSRVNAVVPPVALKGPSITIRKFNATPLKVSDLIGFNSLSFPMASFIEACVKGRCNIMVSGGTGSGKTTLLNVLSDFIPEDERIVTIEDAAELRLMQRHVVTMESRPANIEGKGQITIRDLVRNSLRMRPNRIIVGEVRSGEALDMLQAMNTGHDGSLATAHANSARDLIARLETMVLMTGMELPVKAIREQITSAIDIIVQQARLRDGSRKIVSISEVLGMEGETVTMQDIFVFRQEGYDASGKVRGQFVSTGIRPHVVDKLKDYGISIRDEWFMKG